MRAYSTTAKESVVKKIQKNVFQDFSVRGLTDLQEIQKKSKIPNADLHIQTGRAWNVNELRLKDTNDLEKLWFVLLKEKNRILSDATITERMTGKKLDENKMKKVMSSMRRMTYVLTERQHVRQVYRNIIEDEYVKKMKQKLKREHDSFKRKEIENPPISYSLLRSKFEDLRKEKDDLNYIKKEVDLKQKKENLKKYLKAKYNYSKKKIIDFESMKTLKDPNFVFNERRHIVAFKNQIQNQLKNSKSKVNQEEILRAHIKNWGVLNLKQRRAVLNMINRRRSLDAKSEFTREINLLAQKIAYEDKKLQFDKNDISHVAL